MEAEEVEGDGASGSDSCQVSIDSASGTCIYISSMYRLNLLIGFKSWVSYGLELHGIKDID